MLNVGLISAQEASSATVSGTVVDATTNAPIEGATVEVDDSDPAFSATTDVHGAYLIGNVPVGAQTFTASAVGYESETVGADVIDAEVTSVSFTLQPLLNDEEEEVDEEDEGDEGGKVAGTRRGYVGIYAAASTEPVTGASITTCFGDFSVTTNRGEKIEIQSPEAGLAADTGRSGSLIIKTPGRPGRVLTDRGRVVVLVEFVDLGGDELAKVAVQIVVKPDKPLLPLRGAVVSITTDENGVRTIGIMRKNGKVKEMQLGPDVDVPEIGDLVTAFHGNGGGNGPPIAKGLVRAETLRLRLEGFLEDLTVEGGGPSAQGADHWAQRVARSRCQSCGNHPEVEPEHEPVSSSLGGHAERAR